ncbi:FHA domain-containing protein [Marinicella litoralis]|uniref:GAF domain-containing protein n=1 Tax=Marinicella litoralis TaxID=644220 RepID=A0A4R6XN37_9GAMM|nr:FHA domain-containing protein [Marinicella litoralis]TDR19540.1 GAF domain-containing protein [Marinicella litoralis]
MPAIITACFKDRPAVEAVLKERGQYSIGRDNQCDVILHHPTVSKVHALLSHDDNPWRLRDSSSSNGIQINGDFISNFELLGNELITIGEIECLFEVQSDVQRLAIENHNQWRLSQAKSFSSSQNHSDCLAQGMEQRLFSMLSLTGLQRGMILLGQSMDELVVCSAKGIRFQDFTVEEFEGSIGAIQACFNSGENVIAMDTRKDTMFCKRSSIQQKNIAALCCLPIIEKTNQRIIGLIYLDSKMSSKILSELDLEILNTINEQVLLNLQVINLESQLSDLVMQISQNHSESSVINKPILSLVR